MGRLPVGTCPTTIASESSVRESSHGETADGDGFFPRRDSELIAMEYSHGDTASGHGEAAGG